MEFDIKKRHHPNYKNYNIDDLKIVRSFAKKIYNEFGDYLMGVVLFGSTARKNKDKLGDIDVLLILDDLNMELSQEVVQTYRIITEKVIVDTSKRLHVITLPYTAFWDYVRKGDAVGINILRDGVPIVDTGFFLPLQELLRQGRIKPTMESIYTYLDRAPRSLNNSSMLIMKATLDLYWAVIDSAHAALMRMGEIPPSPAHVADIMDEKLVKNNLLEAKYPKMMRSFFKLQKLITHREVKEITGKAYDNYRKDAQDFVKRMQKFIG